MPDADRLHHLRRMKFIATSMLVLAAVIYLFARANESDGGDWVGYVRSGAEAAMVGALADWFAVTALFRHPLWIPIPHTAIIPNRKDQIGRSLGEFVEGNFLTRDILLERLHGVEIGRRLGQWLAEPVHAERATVAVGDALRGALEVLDDSHVQQALGGTVERRLRSIDAAPIVSRVLDASLDGKHFQRLLDVVFKGLGDFLTENEETFRQQLRSESPWWVPEPIDDRVFNKIKKGLLSFLGDMQSQPDHEVRLAIEERVRKLAVQLREDPEMIAKVEELKDELISHPDVQAWIGSLWGALKRSALHAVDDPQSDLHQRLQDGLVSFGERLATDPVLQRKVDDWVERSAVYLVENYRSQVADLIATTVQRWDKKDTARRIELQVGSDLQYIRINGTVIGCIVGLSIHGITELLFM